MMQREVHSREVDATARDLLKKRGVSVQDIAEIVYAMQSPYNDRLTLEECVESVDAVLQKREIQHAMLVGIELDMLAEKGMLSEPLQSLIESDEGLFGCDETLALGSVLGYGSIGVTTFGHLDKQKVGIIKKLDTKKGDGVHTFLDDLICSVAASASGRMAHRFRDEREQAMEKDQDSSEQAG